MTPQADTANYSIQNRLLISFSVLLFIFLGLTGIVLDSAFRNSIEAGAENRLQVLIYLLLAAADEEDGEFYFLEDLQEPLFSQLNSGLYGFISQASLGELWRSDSALTFTIADPQIFRQRIGVGETVFSKTLSAENEEYFVLSYGILWENGISEYSFTVMENAVPYYSEIANFRTSLWSWLGGVAVLLLLIQVFLMRWGLAPLHHMARDLVQIESGDKDQLEGSYPKELQGVTKNLNLLIETERKQQDRYRTTLGDLAHSLKTPLAVISSVMQKLSARSVDVDSEDVRLLSTVNEQLARMNQIVSYQLQRAVQSHNKSSLAKRVNMAVSVDKVLDALAKVYVEKALSIDVDLDREAVFSGDERDLMEVLGNVLDNAHKYGKHKILVCVAIITGTTTPKILQFIVEDDGPGIAQDKQEFVLQRGARADTLMQGQGIGLAVVTDIVGSYGGTIKIDSSTLGGAKIVIEFMPD